MNIFKSEKTYLMFKTKSGINHVETKIDYIWEYDDDKPDFEYGNEKENAKERARFDSGELCNLILAVRASLLGETGIDNLGGCFVKTTSVEQDLIKIAIEHDMKNNACVELQKNILDKYKQFRNILGPLESLK